MPTSDGQQARAWSASPSLSGRGLKVRGVPLAARRMGQSRAMSREGRHDREALARLDDGS
jgi:hypothetical protein